MASNLSIKSQLNIFIFVRLQTVVLACILDVERFSSIQPKSKEKTMSIPFRVRSNLLTVPPSYSMFPAPRTVLGYDQIAAAINARNPVMSISTIQSVLSAFEYEVKEQLLAGNTVTLESFFSATTSMPGRLEAPNSPLPPVSSSFPGLAFKPSRPFKDDFTTRATFERLPYEIKQPNIASDQDMFSFFMNTWMASSISMLRGADIGFDSTDTDLGVFLTSCAGNVIRQNVYGEVLPSKVSFIPVVDPAAQPGGAASTEQIVEIRTRYTTDGQIRIGTYPKKIRGLNVFGTSNNKLFLSGSQTGTVAIIDSFTGAPGYLMRIVALVDTDNILYIYTMSTAATNPLEGARIPVTANGTYTIPAFTGGREVVLTIQGYDTLYDNVRNTYQRYMPEFVSLNALT